jgi:acyl-CoA thioesterase-1
MLPRILVLGDSVMKGIVFDQIAQRYRILKDGVVSLFTRLTKLEVTNLSVFGATVSKGQQQLQRRSRFIDEYGYALLEFGGNDCDFNWKEIADNPDGVHKPQTDLSDFSERYRAMVIKLRKKGVRPIIMSLPPLDPDRFFVTISKGLNADNILNWLGGHVDTIYRWHESYNLAVMKLAHEEEVPVIDVRTPFLIKHDYRNFICEDGMHPNESGHALILEAILNFSRTLGLKAPVLQ